MIEFVQMMKDGNLEKKTVERPVLKDGEVLLRTLYSEVCGTDVHLSHNQLKGVPYPIIPGHVSVGVIDEMNGVVTDIDGKPLQKGDTVTFLDVHETCHNCWYCLVAKASTRCPNRKVYGITYGVDDGLLGGWSQYILLKDGVKVIRIDPSLDPKKFIAAGCGMPTAIHAVERARISLGDSVVVQGAGPVGLMAAILAKLSGAYTVIMVGAPKLRLDIAMEFGIDHVLNIDELSVKDRLQQIKELTGDRGPDIVLEATGNPRAVKEGLEICRDQGRYVIVGQYTDAGDVSINPHLDINKKHLDIRGSWGSDFSHFYLAVKTVEHFRDEFPWERIISGTYDLDGVKDALADVASLRVMKAIISPNDA